MTDESKIEFWMEVEQLTRSKGWAMICGYMTRRGEQMAAHAATSPDPQSGRFAAVANEIFRLRDFISDATLNKNELLKQAQADAAEAALAHKPDVRADVEESPALTV